MPIRIPVLFAGGCIAKIANFSVFLYLYGAKNFDLVIIVIIRLRRKQNRYPVLFLTNGDTLYYTPMLDLRESTNRMAIGRSNMYN